MRILLINPTIPRTYYNREFYPPLSLLYLAAVIGKNGDEPKILDFKTFNSVKSSNLDNLYENNLIDSIFDFKPELIGIGCLYSGEFPDVLKLSYIIKNRFNNIPIVIGGIHPTIYPYKILYNCPTIDYIIIGEGEKSIIELINLIKNKDNNFENIDGFAYRKNGNVFVNPKTKFIENLDSIPFPAYDKINLEDYFVDTSNWHNPKNLPIDTSIPIITSRSCPNRCNFCSMYQVMGTKWRARSPKNVVDEIEHLYSRYNRRHFSFMDDNLTFKKSHILEICNQIIKRKLNIQFETPNGIATRTLDEDVLDAMVTAGLVRISLAIESGSDFIRNQIMKKNLDREKIFEIVRLTKKYKHLYVKAFFIIGMPEETHETLDDTYNMIKEINVDRIYLQNAIPFPGTQVFEQALRDKLLIDINTEDFYKSDVLYITNYQRIFIKPYNLELKDLQNFRKKCEELMIKVKR